MLGVTRRLAAHKAREVCDDLLNPGVHLGACEHVADEDAVAV